MKTIVLALILSAGLMAESAIAQVIPDGTVGSIVSPTNVITGGTRSGNNLFHSFSQFSIPTNSNAFFNNAIDVQNIFSRVTGTSQSSIDGLIRSQGNANLFLMNPNGILFGPNAKLEIGGSFVGTTANSIKFLDGVEFSANNPSATPLLTMSVPIGLQMGSNPGNITVQGQGNQLTDLTGFDTPNTSATPPGLQIGVNNTLALIGGAVNFSGGVVSTNGGGHLEVGSVSNGEVRLNATSTGWTGDYSAISQFNDIHLAQQSMLDASGNNGSIQLQGKNISLTEGTALFLQTVGNQSSGGITVNATGSLSLTGNTTNGELGSFMQLNNLSTGQTGDIALSAAQLYLQDGARIGTLIQTQTVGGSIIANVRGTIQISGFNPNNPVIYSGLVTFSVGSGNAGNITVSTDNLRILDSASVTSIALESGQTGIIRVNAADQVEIVGFNPMAFGESLISTYTQGSGNANNTIINTSRLMIQGGASLGSSTAASGSAGSVEINASESINIEGRATQGNGTGTISRISSNAEIVSPDIQAAFGLPAIPTGNAGSLTINVPSLRLADGGSVSVKNDGLGLAGNVDINFTSLFLDTQGSITAAAQSGEGGNIFLKGNSLILRHGSLISATSSGVGNGGNITINSPLIVGIENSDIVANASKGQGGNIQITTQGILGLKYRDRLTPGNDITASSQFGVNGTVQINSFGLDPSSGLVKLDSDIVDSSRSISKGCSANQGNSFVSTGRGGIPQNPANKRMIGRSWQDLRTPMVSDRPEVIASQSAPMAVSKIRNPESKIVEASRIQINADGSIALINGNPIELVDGATCSGKSIQ